MIGDKIKEIRKSNNYTQKELADRAKMSRTYLSDVENNRYNPSLDTLTEIAKALSVDLNEIIGKPATAYKVPVFSSVSAGYPLLTNDEIVDYEELPEKPKPDNRTYSKSDVDKIFKLKENDFAKIMCIMIYTCTRPNELLYAKKYNVTLGENPTLIAGMKTDAGKDRIIPIHPKILPLIKYFLGKSNNEYLITYNNDRVRYRYFLDKYNEIIEGLKLTRLTPHKLRKTGATMYKNAGMIPSDLKILLGHADYNTTIKFYYNEKENTIEQAIKLAD